MPELLPNKISLTPNGTYLEFFVGSTSQNVLKADILKKPKGHFNQIWGQLCTPCIITGKQKLVIHNQNAEA